MSQPRRTRRFRDSAVSVGKGSKRRLRRVRARDQTDVGLMVFMIGLAVAALGLAILTGHCQAVH